MIAGPLYAPLNDRCHCCYIIDLAMSLVYLYSNSTIPRAGFLMTMRLLYYTNKVIKSLFYCHRYSTGGHLLRTDSSIATECAIDAGQTAIYRRPYTSVAPVANQPLLGKQGFGFAGVKFIRGCPLK